MQKLLLLGIWKCVGNRKPSYGQRVGSSWEGPQLDWWLASSDLGITPWGHPQLWMFWSASVWAPDRSKDGREGERVNHSAVWQILGHWFCLPAIDVLYMESPASGLEVQLRGWKRPPAPSMEGNHEIHPLGDSRVLASFRSPTKCTRGFLGNWEVPFKNHFKSWPFFFKTFLLW